MKRVLAISLSLIIGILIGLAPPGFADDTELYRGQMTEIGADSRPNILFMLDRSGSMGYKDRGPGGSYIDNGATRMDRLKSALDLMLTEAHNVNIGLASFDGGGLGNAAIMFPVTYIDAPVASVPGESDQLSILDFQVTDGADDAEEGLTSGQVVLNEPIVEMTYYDQSNAGVVISSTATGDAYQYGGNPDTTGTAYMGYGYTAGVRFTDLAIPKGAQIKEARLTFISDQGGNTNNNSLDLYIKVQDSVTPADFTTAVNNLSNRTTLATSVTWGSLADAVDNATFGNEPDIKDLVQAIVNKTDWVQGSSDLVFLLTQKNGTGVRRFQEGKTVLEVRYAGASGSTAKTGQVKTAASNEDAYERTNTTGTMTLNGDFYIGKDGSSNQIRSGLRFANLPIPQGSTIESARIELTGKETKSDALSLSVYVQDSVSPLAFSSTGKDIRNRALLQSGGSNLSVAWNDVGSIDDGTVISTPDLKALLQGLVSKATWQKSSNAAVFTFEVASGSGRRKLYSFDNGNSGRYPTLVITWTEPAGSGGGSGTVTEQPVENQVVGLRFQNVAIPSGVKIKNAYLELVSAKDNSTSASVKIQGEAAGNSAVFSQSAKISARSKTTASVSWNVPAWGKGQIYQSPELKSVVEEVVNRPDWCGRNALSFIISANGGSPLRNLLSYDKSPDVAPKLHVEYDITTLQPGSCMPNEWSAQISAAVDDAEETVMRGGFADNTVFTDSDILEMTTSMEGGALTQRIIGLRFPNVPIHPNTVIEQAELVFTGVSASNADLLAAMKQAAQLTIQGQLGSADGFAAGATGDLSKRAKSSGITWSLPASDTPWLDNEKYTTVDITPVVQAVVNSGGWTAFNNMALFISGTGLRQAAPFERGVANAPMIRVRIKGMLAQEGSPGYYTTVRQKLKSIVSQFKPDGNTPLVDALYETGRYWHGLSVIRGTKRSSTLKLISHPATWSGGTHYLPDGCPGVMSNDIFNTACYVSSTEAEQVTGTATYVKPEYTACQGNHLVFLTDGQATQKDVASSAVQSMIGKSSCRTTYSQQVRDEMNATLTGTGYSAPTSFGTVELCGSDLAEWLYKTDLDQWLAGTQSVSTHTIGLGLGIAYNSDGSVNTSTTDSNIDGTTYLREWAYQGGGKYYAADSAEQLVSAFRSIVAAALTQSSSFSAPAVSVNAFNKLYHNTDVYLALFKPENSVFWEGNVKKYTLCTATGVGACTTELDEYGNLRDLGKIMDKNNQLVTDPDTQTIKDTAVELWNTTGEADGSTVTKAGAGGAIPAPASRKIYTNVATLGNALSEVKTDNTQLVTYLNTLSVTSPATLINWIRGYKDGNSSAGTRDWLMGDPLHSSPGVVTYSWLGTAQTAPTRIFVASNDGSIRMLDAETGQEIWMFMPKDMLAIQSDLMKNENRYNRVYGIDGNPAFIVDPKTQKVKLFIGMRRGGRNIYALDVSNPNGPPTLMWTIKGGEGNFAKLGQTWSTPKPTYVQFLGTQVLMFGGGYDAETQDMSENFGPANYGNAIYIVNPDDGSRLWWASSSGANLNLSAMQYSIPSDLTLMDGNGDGKTDRLYFGDTGGQVWRIDLPANSSKSVGGVLARLSDNSLVENQRRFFYPPDVVRLLDAEYSDTPQYDLVLIGSGHRPNPLGTVIHDRFYALRDRAINWLVDKDNNGVADYQDNKAEAEDKGTLFFTLSHADLYDATDNVLQESNDANVVQLEKDKLIASYGWYIDLKDPANTPAFVGEKVLAPAIVLQGKVYFTTFQPPSAEVVAAEVCAVSSEGTARLYALDILTAGAASNTNKTNDQGDTVVLDNTDRGQVIGTSIPPGAQPVFTPGGTNNGGSSGSSGSSGPVALIMGCAGSICNIWDYLSYPREQVFWRQE